MQPFAFLQNLGTTELLIVAILVLVVIIFSAGTGHGSSERVCNIICPNGNCGYSGPANCVPRGSVLVGLVLLLFGILPGICISCSKVVTGCFARSAAFRSVQMHDG